MVDYFKDYQELFQGCVAYWDGSLTSDGKLQDIIGGYHGTKIGSPTITATNRFGQMNKALDGFSTSNYWTMPSSILSSNISLTISIWIYHPISLGISKSSIFGRLGSSDNYYSIYYIESGGNVKWKDARSATYPTGNSIISFDGMWHLHTFMSDKTVTNIKMYLDNGTSILYTTGSATLLSPTGSYYNIQLGANTNESVYSTNDIGEIMIFDRLLSINEIKTLYNLTKNKYLYPIQSGARGVE